jgi:tyrosine-protein phosphatase YwqE
MFSAFNTIFTSKKRSTPHYLVDLHSHLIPGIDDGSKSMEESMILIRELKNLGFQKLITTPHIMKYRYSNTSKIILEGLEDVREELKKQNIEITLEAAAEYYLDEELFALIENRDILTFGENYLLFEMSYVLKPAYLEAAVYEMRVAGYQPVLAHPERYMFMHHDFGQYASLKEKGVLFQLNLNSCSGYYSKPVQKIAYKLIESGLVDFIGSDTHKMTQIEHFSKNQNSILIDKIFQKNTILNKNLL